MKGNKNTFSNKYIKIMLLALLIISSILSMYLVTNTNNKVFNAKIINQKAINQGIPREVVNIPDQDLKNFLLTYFKKPDNERITNTLILSDNYIKPSDENEIYKDEMEKITKISADNINTKETAMDLTGLEKAINLTYLSLTKNKIENIEPLKGLTNLTELYLAKNKIENVEPLKGLINLITLSLTNNKVENIEPLKGLTQLTFLNLGTNKIENIEPLMGLTSLRNLTLVGNKIENIEPLMGLTNLTDLGLSYNKIENIEPLKGLTNLKSLYLLDNKIENIEPLKGLTQLTFLNLANNKIENIEPLKGLTKLINLYLSYNKIENIEPLKELTNVTTLALYNEEINVSPSTYKFNLPVLKKYNGEILDIVQASNGLLRKNSDGTYSFTRKVTGIQTVNVGIGIGYNDPKVDANWNSNNPIYILKIDPTNIPEEKISITKTIKDKSNTLLNNDKETKVVPVIKQNEQVINNSNTNNVGHRANNDELLTYTWNELPKYDDNYVPYNYEVTFDISGLPEGYSIEPNTKTADNQADFNITYVSLKVTVNKEITVNGGDKSRLPNEITVTISNDKGLPEKSVTATLKADKSGYVVNENLDKTTASAEEITYTVVPKTDITNYTRNISGYRYVSPKVNVTVEKNWVNGETVRPETITAKLKRKIASDNTYTFVQDVTVRKDNNWRLVVSNLDKTDASGNDYIYVVEEETNVDNFNAGYNGLTITNTYVSPKKQLDLRVDVNGGDKNTLPQTIEVEIIDNSDSKNPQVVKTETIILNQDKTAYVGNTIVNTTKPNGQEIPYIVKPKTSLEDLGFRKDQTGNYIYTPKLNTVTGKITYINGRTLWKDLDVKLYKNGNEVVGTTKKITRDELINNKFIASNEEKTIKVVSYENQKETENDGTRNTYEVRITSEVPGFRKEVLKEDKITNIILRYQNEVRDLTYTPIFIGGNANERPELTVILKKKEKTVENPNNETFVEEERKVSVNGNAVTFNQKVAKNYDGTDVEYKFEVTVKPNSNYRLVKGEADGEFKLEYVSPKISFEGKVKWLNGENINKPNVTLGLVRNGVRLEDKYNKVVSTQTGNEVNVTWNDLDKTDKEGNVYTYTIVEDTVLENYTKSYENGNTKVVNTYVSPKINFEKTVKQNGGKNIPVKVTLTRNGALVTPEKVVTVNTGETARFTDLDKTDLNGNPYKYDGVITATLPEGYSWKKDKDGNIVVEYRSPKINLTVEKMWDGGDTLIPENIEVKLKRRLKQVNGNNTNTYVDFENNTYQVEKNNNWTKEITNLEKTDENANEYEYIVEEITNIENFTNKVNNFRITNIYNVPNIDLPINVNITGGNKEKLPSSIEVQIIDKKTGNVSRTVIVPLNGDKTGYSKIENIEKTDKQGNVINYKVKVLTDIPNYVKPENTENTTETLTYKSPKITFEKDIHINPELIKNMKKDGIKDIQVNVMRNGEVIKTITVPLTNFDENGNYKVVVPDLDETDQNGNKYNYDLDIINLVGYDVEKKTDNQGNTVINISKKVERFNKEVTVTTNGGKVRPTVVVELLKNGNKVKETKITNNKVIFENLEKNDKLGNKFEYIVKIKNEEDIRNRFSYEVKLIDSINSEKAVVVLNYIVKKIDVPFKLVYQGANGEEKPKVNIRLLRDGKPLGDIVTLNGEYEYVFKGLDETDQNGNEYDYKVEIVGEVSGYEVTMSPSGKTIILTKKMEKGKFLPYAGTEKKVGVSTLLILMIGYGLKAFKAQKKINTVTNIRGIKR